MQNIMDYLLSAPQTEKQNSTIQCIYYKKYGDLCNPIPVAHSGTNPYISYSAQTNKEPVYKIYGHINKRSDSQQKSIVLQKQINFNFQDNFIPFYGKHLGVPPIVTTNPNDLAMHQERQVQKRHDTKSPTTDILLLETYKPKVKQPEDESTKCVQNEKNTQNFQDNRNSNKTKIKPNSNKNSQNLKNSPDLQKKSAKKQSEEGNNSKTVHTEDLEIQSLQQKKDFQDNQNINKTKIKQNINKNPPNLKNSQDLQKKSVKKENEEADNSNTVHIENLKIQNLQQNKHFQYCQNTNKTKLKQNINKNPQNLKNSQDLQKSVKKENGEKKNSNIVYTESLKIQNSQQKKNFQDNQNTNKTKMKQTANKNFQNLKNPQNLQIQSVKENEKENNSNTVHPEGLEIQNLQQKKSNGQTITTEQHKCNKENNQIMEILKNDGNNFTASDEDLKGNTELEKVTQNLKRIIQNLRKEIQEVPLTEANNIEEVPSALIRTKNIEFFKRPIAKKKPKSPPTTKLQNQKSSSTKFASNARRGSRESVRTNSSRLSTDSLQNRSRSSSPSRASTTSSRKLVQDSTSSSTQRFDLLRDLKEEVKTAIRARKTFTVQGGFCPIRNALRKRGWVEKFHVSAYTSSEEMKRYSRYTINELLSFLNDKNVSEMCRNLIKSKLLGNYQVDFYWGLNSNPFNEYPDNIKYTIINKLKKDIFSYTNKLGLCNVSRESHWYQKRNVAKLNLPRSYGLAAKGEDLTEFLEDFRSTAAMSLLKWIVKTDISKECKLISPSGKIPLEAFDFAVNECGKFIKKRKHEDIDVNIPKATEQEWSTFLGYFYKIIHYSNHFAAEARETEESLVKKSRYVINTLKEVWPFVDMDGIMNLWIMKPIASCRGQGIHMCRTLLYILSVLRKNPNITYVVQKYIERPLLIYNIKFDIRQWFLISNCSPLTIWMYKDCYLRFSSQTYNLRNLHESIHLTNNAVQCKYPNNSVDALPSYNMWDTNEFKTYLANIGYPNVFKNVIYPGMKQCITAVVLMHQDKMIIRKHCFELFGADFILTEDFQPWLLEINSNPAMCSSTPITARMCPKVQEDVIKVIIDYASNGKADTGGFELIYKEKFLTLPAPVPNLQVTGVPVKEGYFSPVPEGQELNSNGGNSKNLPTPKDSGKNINCLTQEIKKTLATLLEIIQEERNKRQLNSKNNKCNSNFPVTVNNKQITT